MAKRPNLSKVELLFKEGRSFKLSREQYIEKTGADIPQEKSYTENKSAIAKMAKNYNFSTEVIPEILIFTKK